MGVTHISLALSNFLCSKMGKKTAYVEVNASNQIHSLVPGTGNKPFTYMGIFIFPDTTITSLPDVLRMDFDYFILDMGVLNAYTAKEFLKHEKQFLVCSLSKWKRSQTITKLQHLLSENNVQSGSLTVLSTSSTKESKITVSDGLTFQVHSVPFLPNPFQLHPEIFPFFGELLG